jgi:protein TonB
MTAVSMRLMRDPAPQWRSALAVVVLAHGAVLAGALLLVRHMPPQAEPPVITVELPPLAGGAQPAAPAQLPAAQPAPQPSAQPALRQPAPPQAVAAVPAPRLPAPADAVAVASRPAPSPALATAPASTPASTQPAMAAGPAVQSAPASAPVGNGASDDPRAKKTEANYFAQVMAYLARRKEYPAEARQARQQGVVTVRFTVDAGGNVSAIGLKRGSGYGLLDDATLALLRKVSPLPPIPRDMHRDSITIALPIEYSLSK